MNQVFVQLNQNFTTLQEQLMAIYNDLIKKNLKAFAEKLLAMTNEFFDRLTDAIKQFKLEQIAQLVIDFLQEAENFLVDLYSRFSLPNPQMFENVTKALIQAIRNQVIEFDQYRQRIFPIA